MPANGAAVVALIEVKAGLLPLRHIDGVGDAVLDDCHAAIGQRAHDRTGARRQPFERAHGGVRAFVDAARARRRDQPSGDFLTPALGTRGQALQHNDVAVTVGDDTGKAVRLAVQHPAGRVTGVEKRPARGRRVRDGSREERGIDRRLRIERPDACADLRRR